ncbi:hypothetical protein D3C81_2097930 [compost metagenome]
MLYDLIELFRLVLAKSFWKLNWSLAILFWLIEFQTPAKAPSPPNASCPVPTFKPRPAPKPPAPVWVTFPVIGEPGGVHAELVL